MKIQLLKNNSLHNMECYFIVRPNEENKAVFEKILNSNEKQKNQLFKKLLQKYYTKL